MHKAFGKWYIDSTRPLQRAASVPVGHVCAFDYHLYYILGTSSDGSWLNYLCLDDPEHLLGNVELKPNDMVIVAEHVEWNIR